MFLSRESRRALAAAAAFGQFAHGCPVPGRARRSEAHRISMRTTPRSDSGQPPKRRMMLDAGFRSMVFARLPSITSRRFRPTLLLLPCAVQFFSCSSGVVQRANRLLFAPAGAVKNWRSGMANRASRSSHRDQKCGRDLCDAPCGSARARRQPAAPLLAGCSAPPSSASAPASPSTFAWAAVAVRWRQFLLAPRLRCRSLGYNYTAIPHLQSLRTHTIGRCSPSRAAARRERRRGACVMVSPPSVAQIPWPVRAVGRRRPPGGRASEVMAYARFPAANILSGHLTLPGQNYNNDRTALRAFTERLGGALGRFPPGPGVLAGSASSPMSPQRVSQQERAKFKG